MHPRYLDSRPSFFLLITALLVCGSVACDSTKAPDSAPKTEKAEGAEESPNDKADKSKAEPEVDTEQTGDAEVVKASAKRVKGDAKVVSRRYRKLLRQGRKEVKSGDLDKGIATFREALKDDPNNATLLGELSFAALKKGKYKLAARAARDCQRHARDVQNQGACAYNLGRALEEQGDLDGAAAAYLQSLEVRPGNKTVEARLAALGKTPPPSKVVRCGGLPCKAQENTSKLCSVLKRHAAENAGMGGDGEYTCKTTASKKVKTGPVSMVGLFEVVSPNNYEAFYYLAMQGPDGWLPAATVGYVYNPGAFGIFEDGSFRMGLKDIVKGGSPEVVVRTTIDRHDTDMGFAEEEDVTVVVETICAFEDKATVCYGPLSLEYTYERVNIPELLEEADMKPNPGLPRKEAYAFDVKYTEAGKVEITHKRGKLSPSLMKTVGVHDLKSLPETHLDVFSR